MAIGEDQRPARRPGVVHVAVLECETLPGPIVETYGGFADIFDHWLQTGVDKVNSKTPPQKRTSVEVSRWPVVHGVYPSDVTRIDAFIITGSICSAYDDFPWIRALEEFVRGSFHVVHVTVLYELCILDRLCANYRVLI